MAPRTQQERREETRARLIAAARDLFGTHGFAATSTTRILDEAGVSRGAMYHHFADKADLFAAVYDQVEGEITQQIATEALSGSDTLDALHRGTDAYLDAAVDAQVARIVLLDAPTALGWERWQALEEQHGKALMLATLQAAIDEGVLRDLPLEPLAHVLLGAMRDAALLLARSENPRTARPDIAAVLHGMVDALAT